MGKGGVAVGGAQGGWGIGGWCSEEKEVLFGYFCWMVDFAGLVDERNRTVFTDLLLDVFGFWLWRDCERGL